VAAIAALLEEVAGSTVVLCSHGDVIPEMLQRLQRMGVVFLSPYEARKGSTWVVGHDGERYVDARYVPPPT
ncbi:MAG TPA: NUDIX hydrolase, partial [Acidimicrobiia bacterium]|nr:NUDIX hydrolase [Acidimicrobiia bacterium]